MSMTARRRMAIPSLPSRNSPLPSGPRWTITSRNVASRPSDTPACVSMSPTMPHISAANRHGLSPAHVGLPEDFGVGLAHRIEIVQAVEYGPRLLGHSFAERLVLDEPQKRAEQPRRVTRCVEQRVDPLAHLLAYAEGRCRDQRQPMGHGLQGDPRIALAARGTDEDVRGPVEP